MLQLTSGLLYNAPCGRGKIHEISRITILEPLWANKSRNFGSTVLIFFRRTCKHSRKRQVSPSFEVVARVNPATTSVLSIYSAEWKGEKKLKRDTEKEILEANTRFAKRRAPWNFYASLKNNNDRCANNFIAKFFRERKGFPPSGNPSALCCS